MQNPKTSSSTVLTVVLILLSTLVLIWLLPAIFNFVGGLLEDLFWLAMIVLVIYGIASWLGGKK